MKRPFINSIKYSKRTLQNPSALRTSRGSAHLCYRILGGRKAPFKFTGYNVNKGALNSLRIEVCPRHVLQINFHPGLGSTALFISWTRINL